MIRRLATVAAVCSVLATAVAAAPAAAAPDRPGGGAAAAAFHPAAHHPAPPAQRAGASQLSVRVPEPLPARAGEKTSVRPVVKNTGEDRSAAFTVVVVLPEGVLPEETLPDDTFFPDNCEVDVLTVVCHYPKGLLPGNTAVAIIPVRIAANATGVLNGGMALVGEDTVPDSVDVAPFDIAVADTVLTDD
ncbi:hypothetical protein [Kitasatospora albolonga]|uniref:hypothetical protein n=1 Tax=Kitasatospora albolonga TaxID=68173 RepID=UPI0031E5385E